MSAGQFYKLYNAIRAGGSIRDRLISGRWNGYIPDHYCSTVLIYIGVSVKGTKIKSFSNDRIFMSVSETCSAFTNLSQAWRHSVELSKSPDAKLSPFVSLSAAAAV